MKLAALILGGVMQVKLRSIVILYVLGAAVGAGGIYTLFAASPKKLAGQALVGSAGEAIVTFTGTLLALASTLLILWLERRSQDKRLGSDLADAHRRIAVEIQHLMQAAHDLLDKPTLLQLTLLPDDVWFTARKMLLEAHIHADDPLDYTLMDFYKRVRVLQMADSKRLDLLITEGDTEMACEIIRRDALAIGTIGPMVLDLLKTQKGACK